MRGHGFSPEMASREADQSITEAGGWGQVSCYSGTPRTSVPCPSPCLKEPLPDWPVRFIQSPLAVWEPKAGDCKWAPHLANLVKNVPSSDRAMWNTRQCSEWLIVLVTWMFSARIYRQGGAAFKKPLDIRLPFPCGSHPRTWVLPTHLQNNGWHW